jgi:dTDP-4-amino-4,6-dideoxygalactose transaminase
MANICFRLQRNLAHELLADMTFVPFNRAPLLGGEIDNLRDVLERRELHGDGRYSQRCHEWLKAKVGVADALLTQSGTAALEMAAILCDLAPDDEVIMPSFTFVSTANAVVLRGAVPVFVDIRSDSLNLDEKLVEAAITPKTKAIFAVHYAGVPCEMDTINEIARHHRLLVVEDAAQALLSRYRGRPAGALGDLACFSFHDSKNIVSGEGGALVTTRANLVERAHIIWEKGTNRRAFQRGEVDKYTWVDIGSSFLPSELSAACLSAQLDHAEEITHDRLETWRLYHDAFSGLESGNAQICRPKIPADVVHNGHLYYLLLRDRSTRDKAIANLRARGIIAPFHYVPLHSAPAGRRFGRTSGTLDVTDDAAARLIRLPLWYGMGDLATRVVEEVSREVLS